MWARASRLVFMAKNWQDTVIRLQMIPADSGRWELSLFVWYLTGVIQEERWGTQSASLCAGGSWLLGSGLSGLCLTGALEPPYP